MKKDAKKVERPETYTTIPPHTTLFISGEFSCYKIGTNINHEDTEYAHLTYLCGTPDGHRAVDNRHGVDLDVVIKWNRVEGNLTFSPNEVNGQEHLDPIPLEIPHTRPLTIQEEIRRFMVEERTRLDLENAHEGSESFEESEDFDIDDEDDGFAYMANHEVQEMLNEEMNQYDVKEDPVPAEPVEAGAETEDMDSPQNDQKP